METSPPPERSPSTRRTASPRPRRARAGGGFRTGHALALVPLGGDAAHAGGYLALAGHYTNGPFDNPQHYRRYHLFGKWTAPVGSSAEFVATGSGYDGRWNASGQIPERAVAAGLITRLA